MMKSEKSTQRTFLPGDEWLYYKLYCGYKTADTLLGEMVGELADRWLRNGWISEWFFIRYADPEPHLRLRFKLVSTGLVGQLMTDFHGEVEAGNWSVFVHKLEISTYERELERYGREVMEQTERLFYHNSQIFFKALLLWNEQEEDDLRWLYGLRSTDALLSTFGLEIAEKRKLLERLKNSFYKEFEVERPLKKQLDQKFRTYRGEIEDVMTADVAHDQWGKWIVLIEEEQSLNLPLVESFYQSWAKGELPGRANWLASCIHMLMNRLFRSKNRLYELVCYDMLYRHYRSQQARVEAV